MFENRNLDRWHDAGLLDDGTRERIRAWEAAHARPVWLWGLAAVGAFAVVLGIVALVAANWDAIPGTVKIGGHLALDAAVAVALFLAWSAGWPRTRELLALLLFGLVLSGIGLIGQVYQLGGTAWQALLTWMVVCTPFLALVTRSGPAAAAWVLGAAATYAFAVPRLDELLGGGDPGMAMAWVPVMALLALGSLRGLLPGGQVQGAWIEGAGCAALLAAASVPQVVLRLGGGSDLNALDDGLGLGLAATLALLPLLALDRRVRGRWNVTVAVIAVAGWATWWGTVRTWTALYASTSGSDGGDGAQLAVALIFIAFWTLASWLALRSNRRSLFAVAFAVIALRVFLFFWEAFGSLLSTGVGLLVGGLACIALAALGWRIANWLRPAVAAR